MKTDYLWDKTGEDAEIERLENALASFRFQAAPTIDAAIVSASQAAANKTTAESFSLKREFSRKLFSFKFAGALTAVCAALILLASVFRLQISSDETNVADQNAASVSPVENVSLPVETVAVNPIDSPVVDFENDAKSTARKIVKRKIFARRKTSTVNFARREKVSPIKSAPAKIRFTDEELYAYNQLKLALSIAGSKLKLVKDKAESADESDADSETRR